MTGAAATMEKPVNELGRDQRGQTPAVWPLQAALPALGALNSAPACGRAWTRAMLSIWDLAKLADSAELVVSELVTNAILVSRQRSGAVLRLSLASDSAQLLIMVRDYEAGTPSPRRAGDDEEDGRGLLLVTTLSARFGWSPPADGTPGKVVWAIL
jgi:anti-sigma regulatory factor (Ser/Thr protein kinase)